MILYQLFCVVCWQILYRVCSWNRLVLRILSLLPDSALHPGLLFLWRIHDFHVSVMLYSCIWTPFRPTYSFLFTPTNSLDHSSHTFHCNSIHIIICLSNIYIIEWFSLFGFKSSVVQLVLVRHIILECWFVCRRSCWNVTIVFVLLGLYNISFWLVLKVCRLYQNI